MSTSHAHLVMKSIACYGRTNIGNFEPDLREIISELVAVGLITTRVDDHEDALWCHLTPAGYEKLFRLNSLDQPSWSKISWDQEPEAETSGA